jgi:hypothetical protein
MGARGDGPVISACDTWDLVMEVTALLWLGIQLHGDRLGTGEGGPGLVRATDPAPGTKETTE